MPEPVLNLLRPYQQKIARAILESVIHKEGLTFTVEIARQGGKNELSSYLELVLLAANYPENRNLIKCSPTFKPQTVISMMRLKEKLDLAGYHGIWTPEMGYIIRVGNSRAIFLSAEEKASVVGNTAHLLLEVDEAQDVNEEKYTKEFKPMGSTTNVTNVLYGTTWDDSTLLEKMKQSNLDLERKDGIKRHFRYDWEEIARYNPDYLSYVRAERDRLGENHPLFLTQYRLLPVRGGGGFLSYEQKAQLQGTHSRLHHPEEKIEILSISNTTNNAINPSPQPKTYNSKLITNRVYVAGIDLAGEAETGEDDYFKSRPPAQDSTVMTIGEVEKSKSEILNPVPGPLSDQGSQFTSIKIVEHYAWTGVKHPDLYPKIIDLVRNVWHCRRVVIDATGIGQPVASFLRNALGLRVVPFTFTAAAKSRLGFNLLAAIDSGGLKMYAGDNSPEYREFWHQMERAKSYYRPSQTVNFYVDPDEGHDDFLMSLALLVEAGRQYEPREARGR